MKKHVFLLVALLVTLACGQKQPEEFFVPQEMVELSGNAFSIFSLGGPIQFYASPLPEDNSKWTVQAVASVCKNANSLLPTLEIDLTPLDARNIRVRDGFTLLGEDISNLLPVFNSAESVEKTMVFSIPEEGKRDYTRKEVEQLLLNISGARMSFNVYNPETAAPVDVQVEEQAAQEKKEPVTLNSLFVEHGVYGLLSRYENALKNGDKKRAKTIEDQLWAIEKRVGNDTSIPKSLRDRFKDYIEDKEDEIEAKY